MTLIGTKDWSNPIAINGKLTGELQYLCVDLEPIGKVQKVLFDNVTRSIPIDWVQIIPDSSSPILLTNIQVEDYKHIWMTPTCMCVCMYVLTQIHKSTGRTLYAHLNDTCI